ncbi:MAG: hypothetical protein MUO97_08655 [Dehalococcoidia bacterium]|nr:hypothetical protein [Dehalococcoidia bacterium]
MEASKAALESKPYEMIVAVEGGEGLRKVKKAVTCIGFIPSSTVDIFARRCRVQQALI